MRAVLGFKSHSGWAALVVLGGAGEELQVLDRRRLELVAGADAKWARQPYHAAEHLPPARARELVRRGVSGARTAAAREVRAAVRSVRAGGHEVVGSTVIVGDPMPAWSVAEILAVHFRMHRAEGALFQEVLGAAVRACRVTLVRVGAREMEARARSAFGARCDSLLARIAGLGKSVGPPWGKDQKDAALAAAIAWREVAADAT